MYIEFLILTCTVRQASLFAGCVTCSLLARAEQLNSFGFLSRQLQIPATSCRSRMPPSFQTFSRQLETVAIGKAETVNDIRNM